MDLDFQPEDNNYQEHFKKTFITENHKDGPSDSSGWTLHDMMIPAGNVAKLINIPDPNNPDFRVSEICDRLKLNSNQPAPVIVLAGAMTQRAGRTLAGVARAAFRTDATIVDSGLGSGIEKFCLRKKVQLIGVAPENEIAYPRITFNQTEQKDNELTNGHTHFILIGSGQEDPLKPANEKGQKAIMPKSSTLSRGRHYYWGDEANLKFDFARRVANGRVKMGASQPCKSVCILVGDNPSAIKEAELAVSMDMPLVVLEGSALCELINPSEEQKEKPAAASAKIEKELARISPESISKIAKARTFKCPDSSEDLASLIHLLLTVSV